MATGTGIEQAAAPPPERPSRSRSIIVIGGAISALIVVAAAIIVVGSRGPTVYPADSPEAAFQAYYAAYEIGDVEAAYGQFSSDVQGRISLHEYRRMDAEGSWQRDQERRVVLERVDRSGDRTTLRVRADYFSPGGLGGNTWSSDYNIRLVREGGAWRIDDALVGLELATYAI
ncbi:MAG: hypothetical protein M3R57_04495 [Chloroflexota bacterium]|nr:hypothetical protein [Chloroflexota bacterium]